MNRWSSGAKQKTESIHSPAAIVRGVSRSRRAVMNKGMFEQQLLWALFSLVHVISSVLSMSCLDGCAFFKQSAQRKLHLSQAQVATKLRTRSSKGVCVWGVGGSYSSICNPSLALLFIAHPVNARAAFLLTVKST